MGRSRGGSSVVCGALSVSRRTGVRVSCTAGKPQKEAQSLPLVDTGREELPGLWARSIGEACGSCFVVLLRAPRSPTKSKGETIRIPRYILYCVVPKVVPGRPAQTRVEVEVRDQANRIRRSGSKTQGWEKEIGRGKRGMRGAWVV